MLPSSFNNNTYVYEEFFIKNIPNVRIGPNGCQAWILDNERCKAVPFYEILGYKENLKRIQKWYQNGWIDQDILSQKDGNNLFLTGRIAIGRADAGQTVEQANIVKKAVPTARLDEWVPLFDGPNKQYSDFRQWNFTCLNKRSKNKERAIMFLDWMYSSQANYDLVHYGIKGKDWIDAGPQKYRLPEGYNPRAEYQFNWYILGGNPTHIRFDAVKSEQDMKYTKMTMDSKNYIPSKLAGFSFDMEPVKAEIAKCEALFSTHLVPLWDGVTTDIDAVTAAYKEAGYEKVVAEIQRQIDAFLATKK